MVWEIGIEVEQVARVEMAKMTTTAPRQVTTTADQMAPKPTKPEQTETEG